MTYEFIETKNGFAIKGFIIRENNEFVYIQDKHSNVVEIDKLDIVIREEVPFT